jgi:hypothetical protein
MAAIWIPAAAGPAPSRKMPSKALSNSWLNPNSLIEGREHRRFLVRTTLQKSCDTSDIRAGLQPGCFCHKTLKNRKIFCPVTAEAAGSSPVSRAILFKHLAILFPAIRLRPGAAIRLRSLFDRYFADVGMIG